MPAGQAQRRGIIGGMIRMTKKLNSMPGTMVIRRVLPNELGRNCRMLGESLI